MRASLTDALRLPSSLRWVCDWLFEASNSPFHAGLTLPPESFSSALAVRVSHSAPCLSSHSELHRAVRLCRHMPLPPPPPHCEDKDAYVLLVPVACMDGVTVGYSFGRGVQHAVPPITKTHEAAPVVNFVVGGSDGSFPNFVGRFAFDAERHDMLVVSSELSDKLCGLLSVSKKGDGRRSRHLIAVPRDDYGFHHLPSRVMFMMANEETKVPSNVQPQFGGEDAGDGHAMQETDPVTGGNQNEDWLHGMDDFDFDVVGDESAPENILSNNGGIGFDGAPSLHHDVDADILAADGITTSLLPIASGPGHQALTPPPLGPFPPLLSPDIQEIFEGGEDETRLPGKQGAQALQVGLQDIDLLSFLGQGSEQMPSGAAHGAEQQQDATVGMGQSNGGAERLAQFLQGAGIHDHMAQALHGGGGDRIGSQDRTGCHTEWLQDRSGCYTEWIQKMRDVEGEGELLHRSSTSTSTTQYTPVHAVANHMPWIVSPTGAMSDGVGLSRQGRRGSSSSGAFDMSTLMKSLGGLARSFQGSYYDKQAQRNFMHPVSGQVVARFMGELRATLDGPEPAVTDLLQQTAMHSYYASVLPVNPDARLLTGTELVWRRTAEAGEGRDGASGAVSVRVNEQDAEAIRAEKRRLRRDRNRLSAARSNEKRRERLEAQERELAELRERIGLLRRRKTVAEEENTALKQSLMRRGSLFATSEGMWGSELEGI